MTHRLAALISGNGSNLQAIIDAIADGSLNAQLALVLSNRQDAGGLRRASEAGIPTAVIDHRNFQNRQSFETAMIKCIDSHAPDTVALAGFMRILSPLFVGHYSGRLLNIHPSLLPLYPGLNTHARALAAGNTEHGCSIHFVTDELDGGPVIAQARVPILANDNQESLSKRVLKSEHRLYPMVLGWRASNRLRLTDQGAELDGQLLPAQGVQVDGNHSGPDTAGQHQHG